MILMAYASKHGGTSEIATRIAAHLEKDGFEVTVTAVDKAGATLGDYRDWQMISDWAEKISATLKKNSTG